jgi:hypothetical protein
MKKTPEKITRSKSGRLKIGDSWKEERMERMGQSQRGTGQNKQVITNE